MKLAFSTLGCPNWSLNQITETASMLGYTAVELRAIDGQLDLLSRPELMPGELGNTRRLLADRDISICCVDTSCAFHSTDRNERQVQVDVAVKHAELAAALGAPLIRVFPDKVQPGATRTDTRDNIAASLREVAEQLPKEVRVGLETHGDFAKAESAAEIVRIADHPAVSLIWDVANSVAVADYIQEAALVVRPYLAHVHLRDAHPVEGAEHWLPVLAGRGVVSFSDALKALEQINYDGYISFEWEKYWHPEIEEPEVALPDFIEVMKVLMRPNVPAELTQLNRT